MLLHIVKDEKFIDSAYYCFEGTAPKQNRFIVVSNSQDLKHIKTAKVEVKKTKEILTQDFVDSLEKYDLIILHSLTTTNMKLILLANSKVKFLWRGFGFDYYNLFPGGIKNLLLPETLKLYKKTNIIRSLRALLSKPFHRNRKLFIKSIKRINYFSPVLPNEYNLCKNQLPSLNAKYVRLMFGSVDYYRDFFPTYGGTGGTDMLVGNSASYYNNHLDLTTLLHDIVNSGFSGKIIFPLNYGDLIYKYIISHLFKKEYGNQFFPLLNFMPKDDYFTLLKSCKYVIMNHLRQQALGNLTMMILMGSSVFLQEKNPIYQYFSNLGIKLFTIKNLKKAKSFKNFNLNNDEIETNRNLLISYLKFDDQSIFAYNRKQLNLIKNDKVK